MWRGFWRGKADSFEACRAKFGIFQVNALDAVGRSHDAGPVEAMLQAEGVAELVDGFLFQAIVEQEAVRGKTIEFIVQATGGDESAAAIQLGFAEDESKNGDI